MLDQKPYAEAASEELAAALEHANLPTLLLCMAQITGEERWLQDPYVPTPPRGPGDGDDGGFSEELQRSIRADALRILTDLRSGELEPAADPSPERIAEMLEISLGVELPDGYGPLLAEELGLRSREVEIEQRAALQAIDVLVIGAGVSGILAAIQLAGAGVPFTVIEKDETVGGTWYENTYPGCGVDTPTHLYSLSFAQRGDWERYFAKRPELYRYLEDVAAEYDVKRHVRFGLEVTHCDWIEDEQRWRVRCVDRAGAETFFDASAIITGTGFFNRPAFPNIPGVGAFAGPAMHTARWDSSVQIAGRRVGVIGTGASAMQLVPSIAGVASEVVVFQRAAQ